MAQNTSIERKSFVASFELIAGGQSFSPREIAPDFIILQSPATVPPGPAELVIRYDDQPEPVRRKIEIVGPAAEDPLRLRIRR